VVLPVKRPITQHNKNGAETATGPLRQRDLDMFGKAAGSAITMRSTDQGWVAILRGYSDHGTRRAEDRKVLRAAQVIRGSRATRACEKPSSA